MLLECLILSFHKRGVDNDHSRWLERYFAFNLYYWIKQASIWRKKLSDDRNIESFIESSDPRTQYRVLELLSKFTLPKKRIKEQTYCEDTIDIVGNLLGKMILFYQSSSPDNEGKNKKRADFFGRYWSLEVSSASILKALEFFLNNASLDNQNDELFENYIFNLLKRLRIEEVEKLNLPDNIRIKYQNWLTDRQVRQNSNWVGQTF